MRKLLAIPFLLVAVCPPAPACSLCGTVAKSMSLAYEYDQAAVVLYGHLANPKLGGKPGEGTTEFHIDRFVKDDPALPRAKMLLLPRYLPILDPKAPSRYVMFIRDPKKSMDPYWGKELASTAVLDFAAELHRRRKDPAQVLLHAGKHLDDADPLVAEEAFLVFAKADDKLIAKTAKQLAPENLRKLVKDPETSAIRLGMFAYLLGACGNGEDAELLRSFLVKPQPARFKAYDGILAGYIAIRPDAGWKLAEDMLKDSKQPFLLRYATLGTLRFLYNARTEEVGSRVLSVLGHALVQPDIADIAIEDLRKWKRWDHTRDIAACWTRPGFDGQIMRQRIIQYALTCPLPEARELLARARRDDPELVRDLEQEFK